MISRLLVAVLLFGAVAITTPNSTEAAAERQSISHQPHSSSISTLSFKNDYDYNHHRLQTTKATQQVVAAPNAPIQPGDRKGFLVGENNSQRRNHEHHLRADPSAELTLNDGQTPSSLTPDATFSDPHDKQASLLESTSGTISAAAVTTAVASNKLNLKQQDSERTASLTNVATEQHQQRRQRDTGSANGVSGANGSENVDSQTRQQQQQQQTSTPSVAEATTAASNKNTDKNSQQQQHRKIFTNQFVIEIKGGKEEARRLAVKHGFIYLDHIIDDYYHLEHRRLAKRSINSQDLSELDISIEEEPHVLKLERQVLKTRVKRDFMDLGTAPPTSGQGGLGGGLGRVHAANNQQQQQRQMLRPPGGRPAQSLRPANQPPATPPTQRGTTINSQYQDTRRFGSAAVGNFRAHQQHNPQAVNSRLMSALPPGALFDQLEMTSSGPPPFFVHANYSSQQQQQVGANNKHRPPPPPLLANGGGGGNQTTFHYANESAPFNDPSWPHMWYLDGGARNGFDLNVQAAWQMGYTGKGIVITILDDGLEKDHPDLQANYDPLASFDINGDDADPMPRYDANDSNRHGTRCAGEVAAVRDNNICSIGIAYNSKVGGVRMLDGDVTDAVEARSLGLNNQHIHIYSASWGPDDNGKTVDGPGELATRAFIEGVTNGRQGLGSIFVFASGNGGREHDNCNCDGYTNSIWTLSISSATQNGYVPWYIENCSSTLAATYSSGSLEEKQIATTDIRHSCTNNHTGTSASAPIAAGICALVLESNPRLTWRDMQHIVVRTAKPANLIAKDWRTNALGRNVSHAFGYGLMDAAAMIHVAKQWTTVPLQYTCEVRSPQMERPIPAKGYIELKLRAECANVRYLEHVQSKITLSASRRGDLHIYLTSPHGTRSTLLAQRPYDQADQGFRNWPFMTVHSWGESPNGVWTLEVHNDGKSQTRASLKEWTLVLYGTSEDPNKHLSMNSGAGGGNQMIIGTHSSPTAHPPTVTSQPPPPPPPPAVVRLQPQASSTSPPPPSFSPSVEPKSKPQLQQPTVSAPPPPLRSDQQQTTTTTPSSPVLVKTTQVPPQAGRPVGGATSGERPPQAQGENNKQDTNIASDDYHGQHGGNRQQAPKVDFEIVSPSGAVISSNQQQQPSSNESSTRPQGYLGEDHMHHQPQRPHIHLIDNNKIDAQTSTTTPAEATTASTITTTTTTTRPPVLSQQQNELDANQLDSRLTKDYRSSGGRGHDVASTTTAGSASDHDVRLGSSDTSGDTNGDLGSGQHPAAKQRQKQPDNNSAVSPLSISGAPWFSPTVWITCLALSVVTHRQHRALALVH